MVYCLSTHQAFRCQQTFNINFLKYITLNESLAKDMVIKTLPNASKKLFSKNPAMNSFRIARDGCRNNYRGSLSGIQFHEFQPRF